MIEGPRHFLDISALSREDLRAIIDEAHARKAARVDWPKAAPDEDAPLDGHALAMIFQKNSTRTRVSFEIGMIQLGGKAIVLNANDTQLGRGETVEDTARVLSRMVDAVMIRANNHQDVVDFAAASDVPVINGLTDLSHPCQIIADIVTIEERMGDISGKTIAWLGDGNNVCTSFMHAAEKLDFKLRIATPANYAPRGKNSPPPKPQAQISKRTTTQRKRSKAPTSSSPTHGCRWAIPIKTNAWPPSRPTPWMTR